MPRFNGDRQRRSGPVSGKGPIPTMPRGRPTLDDIVTPSDGVRDDGEFDRRPRSRRKSGSSAETQPLGLERLARDARPDGGATTSDQPVRVLLVGALSLMVEAIGRTVAEDPEIYVVGVMANTDPDSIVEVIASTDAQVVLIDCTTSAIGWPQVVASVCAACPTVRVVVLTATSDVESLVPYVLARAVGCVTGDRALEDVILAVKRAHAGEVLFPSSVLIPLLTQQGRPRSVPTTPPAGGLAPRERQVLATLATGASTEEVAHQLGITIHTVRTHLKNAMVKLKARS